jgi:hypothetical protein
MKTEDLFVNYVSSRPRMLRGDMNLEISPPTTITSQYLTPSVSKTHYGSGNESIGKEENNK